MAEGTGKLSLSEFLVEAQEIVEEFGRLLMELDRAVAAGTVPPPDLVNSCFRSIHTLKGLSGLSGVESMARLAHIMEDVLDGVRMGRVAPERGMLDLLFESSELLQAMMAAAKGEVAEPVQQAESLMARLQAAAAQGPSSDRNAVLSGLDPSLLEVLTEYEEHRLRENVSAGKHLYVAGVNLDIVSVDKDLDAVRAALQGFGEVITYLPAEGAVDDSKLALEILFAGDVDAAVVLEAVQAIEPTSSLRELKTTPARPVPMLAEPAEAEPAAVELSIKSVAATVRVDIGKLDSLMNVVGELNMSVSALTELLTSNEDVRRSRSFRHQHFNVVYGAYDNFKLVANHLGRLFGKNSVENHHSSLVTSLAKLKSLIYRADRQPRYITA